jgi:hypothetical protein
LFGYGVFFEHPGDFTDPGMAKVSLNTIGKVAAVCEGALAGISRPFYGFTVASTCKMGWHYNK